MIEQMDPNRIPAHIAIVMDGNGRWAEKRGVPRLAGHNAGMEALKDIVRRCGKLGVSYLTVYAFSTENWKRSAEEVGGIFRLLVLYVDKELETLHGNNVRISVLGTLDKLPPEVVASLKKAVERTAGNTELHLCIALNYGGRDEILRACRSLSRRAAAGELSPEALTEEDLSRSLDTGDRLGGVPDPDMIIRTSGELRLSNFLLWQSAYSELVITDTLWPDFTPRHLEEAIAEYQRRQRRFGGRGST